MRLAEKLIAGNGNMKKVSNIVLRRICFGSLNIRFSDSFRISDFVLRIPYGEFRVYRLDARAGVQRRWFQWADR